MRKAEFSFSFQVHPSIDFTALEDSKRAQQGLNYKSNPRFVLRMLAPAAVPGRESFSLRFHVFRPYVLSFVLPGTWSDFHSPCLQKQALEGKGQSRTWGIKDPEPSPQSCSSWWQQPSCLIPWHHTFPPCFPPHFTYQEDLDSCRACLCSSYMECYVMHMGGMTNCQCSAEMRKEPTSPPLDVAGRHENYSLEAELILHPGKLGAAPSVCPVLLYGSLQIWRAGTQGHFVRTL